MNSIDVTVRKYKWLLVVIILGVFHIGQAGDLRTSTQQNQTVVDLPDLSGEFYSSFQSESWDPLIMVYETGRFNHRTLNSAPVIQLVPPPPMLHSPTPTNLFSPSTEKYRFYVYSNIAALQNVVLQKCTNEQQTAYHDQPIELLI